MSVARIVALWLAASVPIAVAVAAAVRATRDSDLAEEVERYLEGLTTRRRRSIGRPLVIAALCAGVAALGVTMAAPIAGVTDRVYTVASGTRALFGDGPGSRAARAPDTPPTTASAPSADRSSTNVGHGEPTVDGAPVDDDGTITAAGILADPTAADDQPEARPGSGTGDPASDGADGAATDAAPRGDHESDGASGEDDEDDDSSTPGTRAEDGEPGGGGGRGGDDEGDEGDDDEGDDHDGDGGTEPAGPEHRDIDRDGIADHEDGDLDGDGIPNDEDDDLDGDGIPNDEDGDLDGDGIPNDEDPTPSGPADDGPGGANGDGSADSQETKREGGS